MLALAGVTLTLTGGGGGGLVMVTAALPAADDATMLVACTVTVAGVGTLAGALYRPLVEIVPNAILPPATPFTSQVTDWFELLATIAENCLDVPAWTLALAGVTLTLTGGAGGVVIVTAAL